MADTFCFPFRNLNDIDFSNLIQGHQSSVNNGFPISELDSLCYCPIDGEMDAYMEDVDPDNYFVNTLRPSISECKYYFLDAPEYLSAPCQQSCFSLIHLNIGSIPKNLDTFTAQCMSPLKWYFDIVAFTETKLNNEIENLYDIPRYTKFCNNNSRNSGGVALYVLDVYSCHTRPDLIFKDECIESLFVQLADDFLVGVVYRRPNTNPKEFLDKFQNILIILKAERKRCYVMGDFNLDLLKWDTSVPVNDLIAICHSKMFLNTISKPTRVTDTSATLIDHIWSNDSLQNIKNGILYTNISDHFPVFAIYEYSAKDHGDRDGKTVIQRRNFSNENITRFKDKLREVNWELIYASENPNVCFATFLLIFCACFNLCFPLEHKVVKSKSLAKPYITAEIKGLIAERNKIQRKYAKRPITYGEAYRTIRNRVTQMIRAARSNYFKHQLEIYCRNLKKYWKVINDILCRKRKSASNDSQFKVSNRIITDRSEVVEGFNGYFVGVGETLARQCPSLGTNYRDYLRNRIEVEFCFPEVTENMFLNVVNNMKNTAAGHDDIPMFIIKRVASDISAVLVYLCNISFSTGTFPSTLEIAKVLPFFKSGDKMLFKNYRPISVLPALSKILEKIASDSFRQFCSSNSIITDAQYGFMQSKNTEDATLAFVGDINRAFDEGEYTIGVFLDLSKAFDTVDHKILLAKLEHYGVRNRSYNWFSSYLQFRKQYVSYDGYNSDLSQVHYGVPQGSILGPLLFVLYINDIVNTSEYLRYILFADDSNFYISHTNINYLLTLMNQEMDKIQKWVITNKLTINISKTHYMIFHRRKLPLNLEPLSIGETVLERVSNTKFLGITIEDNLKWHKHALTVARKLDKLSGILYQTRHMLTERALKQIYYALIYPNIIYCQTVWGAAGSTVIKQVIKSHKRVLRTIVGVGRYAHTDSFYSNLKILKLEDINIFCCALYVFKSLNNLIVNRYFTSRSNDFYSLRDPDLLRLPAARTTQSQSFISYHGVKVWNSLPQDVRNKTSLHSFKMSLKTYLFNKYQNNDR